MNFDKDLMEILACPKCHSNLLPLVTEGEGGVIGLKCESCSCVYPVLDGIPLLLKEESVSALDWAKGIKRSPKARH